MHELDISNNNLDGFTEGCRLVAEVQQLKELRVLKAGETQMGHACTTAVQKAVNLEGHEPPLLHRSSWAGLAMAS